MQVDAKTRRGILYAATLLAAAIGLASLLRKLRKRRFCAEEPRAASGPGRPARPGRAAGKLTRRRTVRCCPGDRSSLRARALSSPGYWRRHRRAMRRRWWRCRSGRRDRCLRLRWSRPCPRCSPSHRRRNQPHRRTRRVSWPRRHQDRSTRKAHRRWGDPRPARAVLCRGSVQFASRRPQADRAAAG